MPLNPGKFGHGSKIYTATIWIVVLICVNLSPNLIIANEFHYEAYVSDLTRELFFLHDWNYL